MSVKELTQEEFSSAISEGTCMVDFFASWCGPCKMMAPVFESTAMSLPNVKFYKIDVDKAMKIAMEYNIVNVPTIVVFKDGQPVNRLSGAVPKSELMSLVD